MKRLSLVLAACAGLGLTIVDASAQGGGRPVIPWKDAQGNRIWIPLPRNYAECRDNNRKYTHYSEAESHRYCSSPDRWWNKRR